MSFHFLFFVLLVSIVFSDLCCKDVREPEVLVILVFTGVCVFIQCVVSALEPHDLSVPAK